MRSKDPQRAQARAFLCWIVHHGSLYGFGVCSGTNTHTCPSKHTYHRHNTRTTAIIKHLPQYRVSLCTCVIRKTEKLYFFFFLLLSSTLDQLICGRQKERERWTWSKHRNHNKIRLFQGPRNPLSPPHCFFPPSLSLLCLVFVCVAIVSN